MSRGPGTGMRDRPLIIVMTAGMGAGHDQVGRELSSRLSGQGVGTELVDVGRLLPVGFGRGLTGLYKFMAVRAPWLYGLTFQLAMRPGQGQAAAPSAPLAVLARRRLRHLVAAEQPALIVSTFRLCSQVAGRMRAEGELQVPVVSFVLDFFVHGMWAHPGVDAHLLVHQSQCPQLMARGGRRPVVCGPVVRPAFAGGGWDRTAARRPFGLQPGQPAVLVVAGSWGVGKVTAALDALLHAGGSVPLVVAGRNAALRASLLKRCPAGAEARVFGWVDDMDQFMAAADVVVENAGGLTAMEAMASGAPVVSYRPIAGHGRANAEEMARAGVSVYARNDQELVSYLDTLVQRGPLRQRLVERAQSMFCADAAEILAAWAKAGAVGGPVAPDDGTDFGGPARGCPTTG